MAKAVQAYTTAGWRFVPNCQFQVNYSGEADYTPFVQKLQSCGAQTVYTDVAPGPVLYGALEAENQIGYNPIWVEDSASYTAAFAKWNTDGLGNNTYVRLSYEPLEAAKVVPAVTSVPRDRKEVRRIDIATRRAGNLVLPVCGPPRPRHVLRR